MAKKVKIMIDAGHYGNYYNKGAIDGYYESNMNWELQGYLKAELEAYGFEVGTTRKDKAKDMAVVDRGLASKGYDLFLSLHSNAASAPSADYVALFHLVDDRTTNVDTVSKLVAKKLAPVIADLMQTKQKYQVLTRAVDFDRDGDGQLNDNYYGVLHGADLADTAGVIIEHSFHTNPDSCRWLMNSNNLKKMAAAEAAVLAELWGLKKPVVEETKPVTTPTVTETPSVANPEVATPPSTPAEPVKPTEPVNPVEPTKPIEPTTSTTEKTETKPTETKPTAKREYYVMSGAYISKYYADKQLKKVASAGFKNIAIYKNLFIYHVGIGPYTKAEANVIYKSMKTLRLGASVTKYIGKLVK